MLFRLCLAFGAPYVHPDRLAADLTTREVDDWILYGSIEAFGSPADDYRAALAAWGGLAGRAGNKKLTPDKLVPVWSSEPLTYKEKAMLMHAKAAPR
jgi:hypothetical protein